MESLLHTRMNQLHAAREKSGLGGGIEKTTKLRNQGKKTARERLALLLDADSFLETNPLIGHLGAAPGDGIVAGFGTVWDNKVSVYSQDATVKGGSIGREHGWRMYRSIERALELRIPLIGIHDSPGARLPGAKEMNILSEQSRSFFADYDQKHGGSVFYPNTEASGVIPQISAIMGSCGGISVYSPALTDFIFMVDKTSHMFITGPKVVKAVLGEEISMEDLGGAATHAQITGVCDFRCATEQECLEQIRRLLSFLPSHCDTAPPAFACDDDINRRCPELTRIVPDSANKPYDVIEVIRALVDRNDFLEVKAEFAREVVVGFGRMDGKTVGIVANQPKVLAGAMTTDSSDKQARFIRFCDSFNIPLLFLVDTPAYMPGSAQEHAGIIRHGAKVLYALCEARVPRISLVLRKAYGGGNLGMGVLPGMGTDIVLNWPLVETGILGAQQSVALLFAGQGLSQEQLADKLQQYRETYANPIYDVSSNLNVENVISPDETRTRLIHYFRLLEGKKRPHFRKRHGNIPL